MRIIAALALSLTLIACQLATPRDLRPECEVRAVELSECWNARCDALSDTGPTCECGHQDLYLDVATCTCVPSHYPTADAESLSPIVSECIEAGGAEFYLSCEELLASDDAADDRCS